MLETWAPVLLVIVSSAVLFSFVAVVLWMGARRKEREAYYRSETIKKIAESGTSQAALEYLRETERIAARRTRDGLKLGGLVALAAGVGLMVFLISMGPGSPYQVGLIPLFVGAALFGYGQFLAPKD